MLRNSYRVRAALALLALAPLGVWVTASARQSSRPEGDERPTKAPAADPLAAVVDAPLRPERVRLLQLAFESASKLPLEPHGKNRARAQASVVDACLALDQVRRALDATRHIEGWRRGVAYAEIGRHLANGLQPDAARRALELAREVHREAGASESQEWRADRILAGVARVELALGDLEPSVGSSAGIDAAELTDLVRERVQRADAADFELQVTELERLLASGDFNLVRNALVASAALHGRFYGEADRRARLVTLIQASWRPVPADVQLDLIATLTENALAADDRASASAHIATAQGIADAVSWTVEHRVPVSARIAMLRFHAGDEAAALAQLAAAVDDYDAGREQLYDVFRAGVLRPIAEAYASIGRDETALDVYRRVIAEGATNPNSRPRAEDLVATCCSLARSDLAIPPEILARISVQAQALGAPW